MCKHNNISLYTPSELFICIFFIYSSFTKDFEQNYTNNDMRHNEQWQHKEHMYKGNQYSECIVFCCFVLYYTLSVWPFVFLHWRKCAILYRTRLVTYRTVEQRTVPYRTAPHHTIPYHTAPRCTVPHQCTSYRTAPHHTAPHHTIPYRTVPHHSTPFEPWVQVRRLWVWNVSASKKTVSLKRECK